MTLGVVVGRFTLEFSSSFKSYSSSVTKFRFVSEWDEERDDDEKDDDDDDDDEQNDEWLDWCLFNFVNLRTKESSIFICYYC